MCTDAPSSSTLRASASPARLHRGRLHQRLPLGLGLPPNLLLHKKGHLLLSSVVPGKVRHHQHELLPRPGAQKQGFILALPSSPRLLFGHLGIDVRQIVILGPHRRRRVGCTGLRAPCGRRRGIHTRGREDGVVLLLGLLHRLARQEVGLRLTDGPYSPRDPGVLGSGGILFSLLPLLLALLARGDLLERLPRLRGHLLSHEHLVQVVVANHTVHQHARPSVADAVAGEVVLCEGRVVRKQLAQRSDHLGRVRELVVVHVDLGQRLGPPGAVEHVDDALIPQVVAAQHQNLQGVLEEHENVGDVLPTFL
mmetsp:Transcript_412/g.1089  ORF Transcript_412/g.1089 Transcript_412/m.1089 type:complete len:309 (-) Transcript_412:595-1521(-)